MSDHSDDDLYGDLKARVASGRHDHALRRRSQRAGRETGCWVYIPGEVLAEAGVESAPAALPYYRTWPLEKAVIVRLYRVR